MSEHLRNITRRPWRGSRLHSAKKQGARAAMFVGAVAAFAVATVFGIRALQTSDVLLVEAVNISGVKEERAREVLSYAQLEQGTPLFAVDPLQVQKKVEAHPYISSCTVEVSLPHTVNIHVDENVPFALVAAETLYVVDDNGKPFTLYQPDHADLPLLTGDVTVPEVADRLDAEAVLLGVLAVHAHRDVKNKLAETSTPLPALEEVHLVRGFGVEVVLDGGLRARLGENGLHAKLERLTNIIQHLRNRGHEPAMVHLDDGRRPERVAVRLRPASEMKEDTGS